MVAQGGSIVKEKVTAKFGGHVCLLMINSYTLLSNYFNFNFCILGACIQQAMPSS